MISPISSGSPTQLSFLIYSDSTSMHNWCLTKFATYATSCAHARLSPGGSSKHESSHSVRILFTPTAAPFMLRRSGWPNCCLNKAKHIQNDLKVSINPWFHSHLWWWRTVCSIAWYSSCSWATWFLAFFWYGWNSRQSIQVELLASCYWGFGFNFGCDKTTNESNE